MGWYGKLTFGALGLFLGGPLGAIAGAALGHHLIDKKGDYINRLDYTRQEPILEYREQTQATHFISLFSILGKLAKIDGVVAKSEITVVENFINNLNMAEGEKQFAKQIFNVPRVVCRIYDPLRQELYQTLGLEAISPTTVFARLLKDRLES